MLEPVYQFILTCMRKQDDRESNKMGNQKTFADEKEGCSYHTRF